MQKSKNECQNLMVDGKYGTMYNKIVPLARKRTKHIVQQLIH